MKRAFHATLLAVSIGSTIYAQTSAFRTKAGHAILPSSSSVTAAMGPNLFIWADKGVCLPGEEIRVYTMGFSGDATNLLISYDESFFNAQGDGTFQQVESNIDIPCDCGGNARGMNIGDLSSYKFRQLFTTRVPGLRIAITNSRSPSCSLAPASPI
jgi:hypothetical protein